MERLQSIEMRLRALAERGDSPGAFAQLEAARAAVRWAHDAMQRLPVAERVKPDVIDRAIRNRTIAP